MGRYRKGLFAAAGVVALLLAAAAVLGAKPRRPAFVVPRNHLAAPLQIPAHPRPGPVPNCRHASIRCVRTVVARLREREKHFGCNHRAVFFTTYRVLTQGILKALTDNPHQFHWPRYLYFEDALFADVLMSNGRAYDRGRRVSPAWQIAWDAARDSDSTATEDMLLGINAHVQNDMPFVIAALGTRTGNGTLRKSDHDLFNEVLAGSYSAVVHAVGARYDSAVSLTNPDATTADDTAGLELVRRWREDVWTNANRLIDADTATERATISTEIENNAATWANLIAAGFLDVPGYRAQRDAYCAAHNPDA